MNANNEPTFLLKQLAVVAGDLDQTVSQLTEVFDLTVCFNDPGVAKFGLINALMACGETFLEVVCPNTNGTTAERLLEKRRGDGGYMVLVQTDNFALQKQRVQKLGTRIIWEAEQAEVKAMHLHPKDVGAAIVSIDQMVPPDYWVWAGPSYKQHQTSSLVKKIKGVVIQGDDPAELAQSWGRLFNLPHGDATEDFCLSLKQGSIRFVGDKDGRGPGVAGIILETINAEEIKSRAASRQLPVTAQGVEIGGVHYLLE